MLGKAFFCVVLFIGCMYCTAHAQQIDSVNSLLPQTATLPAYTQKMQELLKNNVYLNITGRALPVTSNVRNVPRPEPLFYILFALVFFIGILNTFYRKYLANIFRVFFNTSLRQNQLTDQLMQSQLPSLFLNIFFILSSALFLYLALSRQLHPVEDIEWKLLGLILLVVFAVYIIKYFTLQFAGWLTGYKAQTKMYTFIVFLINKVAGIMLLPFLWLLSFGSASIANAVPKFVIILAALLFLFRYVRTFSNLRLQLKISGFHFLLYILGIEILPLLVLYRLTLIFFNGNL